MNPSASIHMLTTVLWQLEQRSAVAVDSLEQSFSKASERAIRDGVLGSSSSLSCEVVCPGCILGESPKGPSQAASLLQKVVD